MATAWSFLTLADVDRQYVGNEGYADQLDTHYVFDSTVANHGRVAIGDLAVLRDSKVVLGVGWIDVVDVSSAEKVRRRCPACRRTGFKLRRSLTPAFKCGNCGEQFDDPLEERIEVRQFIADYGRTFAAVDGVVTVSDLGSAYFNRAVQHAVRELDLERVRTIVGNSTLGGTAYWTLGGGVRPSIKGGRTERLGKFRIGQQSFRERLLQRFGSVCAFTGPQHPAALDAAHVYRYCDIPEHDTDSGLLLRRDLHSLFDRWLIAIDPDTWKIRLSPQLVVYTDLAKLDGAPLQVAAALRPRRDHLSVHFEMARTGW